MKYPLSTPEKHPEAPLVEDSQPASMIDPTEKTKGSQGEYGGGKYRQAFRAMIDKQADKGFHKYGQYLEDNPANIVDRLNHAQEEIVDQWMYMEWVKDWVKRVENGIEQLNRLVEKTESECKKNGASVPHQDKNCGNCKWWDINGCNDVSDYSCEEGNRLAWQPKNLKPPQQLEKSCKTCFRRRTNFPGHCYLSTVDIRNCRANKFIYYVQKEAKQMERKWHFPAVRFTQKNNSDRQAGHVFSESAEAQVEMWKKNQEKLDEEMADLLHSCETYFRIREKEGADLKKIFDGVIWKNQNRGYYE